jgi:hypothetical protein
MAWQLWHLTERVAVCHPRSLSGIARNAATKSFSSIGPPPTAPGCIGETVPQNGQTSAFFVADHSAAPPHAGHANRAFAVSSAILALEEFV